VRVPCSDLDLGRFDGLASYLTHPDVEQALLVVGLDTNCRVRARKVAVAHTAPDRRYSGSGYSLDGFAVGELDSAV
jgi:hypothetical protein